MHFKELMAKNRILGAVKEVNPLNPLAFAHDIVRDYAREKLDEYILQCKDCDICSGPKSVTKGNSNAAIMVIGESVAAEQLDANLEVLAPMEGTKSFELLKKVFDYYEVNQDDVFYINAVNCHPKKEVDGKTFSRTPSKEEVDNCNTFLNYAIEVVKPTVIILLGAIALNSVKQDLTSPQREPITKARGIWTEVKGIPAMPTFHPEYFSQIEGKKHPDIIEEIKADFCDDIRIAVEYVQKKNSNNNLIK